jgi:hypothetical protein
MTIRHLTWRWRAEEIRRLTLLVSCLLFPVNFTVWVFFAWITGANEFETINRCLVSWSILMLVAAGALSTIRGALAWKRAVRHPWIIVGAIVLAIMLPMLWSVTRLLA